MRRTFEIKRNANGREVVVHDGRLPGSTRAPEPRVLVAQAIAVPERSESALMVGSAFLQRDQVAELRDRLARWIDTGSLALEDEAVVEMPPRPPAEALKESP